MWPDRYADEKDWRHAEGSNNRTEQFSQGVLYLLWQYSGEYIICFGALYVRYGTLYIQYVGRDEPEEITDKEQVWGMDMKWGTGKYKHGLIEDADEHGYEYQDDATNTEEADEEDK